MNANDKNPLADAHDLIRKNKIDEAIIFLKQEIPKSESEVEKALFLVELGNAYKLKQQYEKSLNAYQTSLQIFQRKGLLQNEFLVYTQLAEFYRYRRMYSKSEEYLKLCENILKREKITDAHLMKFYSRKAALFSEYQNNQDSAISYSKKSLKLSQKLGDSESELVSLMEIAGIYENKKKYAEAIKQFSKIINLAAEKANIQLQCDAMVNLSRNYNAVKNYKASIDVSLMGFDLAEKNKLSFNQLLFADNLQMAYAKTGYHQNAFKFLSTRLKLTEEYYHKLYDNKVLEYEEKFKVAEKQKIINENKKLIELKEEEIKRQSLIKYFILFGLIAILIFAAILLNYIKIIRKQNKRLTFVSEQNEFLVSETHHRINNNLQLITILIQNELKKNPNSDDLTNQRIIAKIDSLGILHRQLYENQDKKNLDLNGFLLDVKKNMDLLFTENNIQVHFDVESILIPVNSAMYIGLLVTELCINSMKHAFLDQSEKRIDLRIHSVENHIYFDYQDNGEVKKEITKLNLIEKLCRQLKIKYKVDVENGFKFSFNRKL
ncbi:sensor histidine kinase [Chryseobacterium sp. KACC 21268]|nr:sensor histidine kinase [Chryseobacterium sp. KACC 21268]